jgi:hypothetical protein
VIAEALDETMATIEARMETKVRETVNSHPLKDRVQSPQTPHLQTPLARLPCHSVLRVLYASDERAVSRIAKPH